MDSSLASLGANMLSQSSDLPEFVNKVAEKYICCVCGTVLRNAMQLQCGHQICESCIDPLFGENDEATCPVMSDEECEQPFSKKEVNGLPYHSLDIYHLIVLHISEYTDYMYNQLYKI